MQGKRVFDYNRSILPTRQTRPSSEGAPTANTPEPTGPVPAEILPQRTPSLPRWLRLAELPEVLLEDRSRALPTESLGHICTMLMISSIEEPYAGIEIVRQATDHDSLAAMAWAVFEQWGEAGYPSGGRWALRGLAFFGDDGTVRRLAPLMRAWPSGWGPARAVNALKVLSGIGTDVALMHLHSIADNTRVPHLSSEAWGVMREVAEGRGLTVQELADRAVPHFGLDARGSMVVDYGSRRFVVTFDEQLKPVVADADGARRKLLPRPGARDDAALAPAAYDHFRAVKADVKQVVAHQTRRFENAMVARRRWSAAHQQALFLEHPLMWQLARRLVWATFDARGEVTGTFRVAEDRTLANESDEEITLDGGTPVGIVHPLPLGAPAIAAWSEIFADYNILQPFPQITREVFTLTDEERRSTELARFHNMETYAGKILSLAHRGWERPTPIGGAVHTFTYKEVADDLTVVVDIDPGITVGDPMADPEQTVTSVWLNHGSPEYSVTGDDLEFGLLEPITASEVLRDLEGLRL